MIGILFGRSIGQSWDDLKFWEALLNEYEDHGLKWILELGTYQGGMSFYLYSQAYARGFWFATIDVTLPDGNVPPLFHLHDLATGFPKNVSEYVDKYPGVLFCDNGNKPKEVQQFKDQIHPESLIVIHDWMIEFMPTDIPDDYRVTMMGETSVAIARNDFLNSRLASKSM